MQRLETVLEARNRNGYVGAVRADIHTLAANVVTFKAACGFLCDKRVTIDPLNDAVLSDDDWLELAGFAFTHRPLLTSLGCLLRLLQTSELALPALRGRLQKNASDAQLCTTLKLSGRKLLLVRQREEAAQALFALDDVRTERLRDRITQWQFFH